ncbi:MAG TPA: DUF3168 domain-containing protein [Usitatibacter sp.]|nr:DUF3168 domain-containing protein [Usitatibacter sp.]
MSGVSAIRFILANNSALTAAVPAANIFVGTVPLNTVLPAIGVTKISGVPNNTVAMTESGRIQTERVQVTLLAKTSTDQLVIGRLIRAAVPNRSGTVNGVHVDSILPDSDGPDLDDDTTSILENSRDFIVRWHLP